MAKAVFESRDPTPPPTPNRRVDDKHKDQRIEHMQRQIDMLVATLIEAGIELKLPERE